MSLEVQVVSPERILWTGQAQMVIARTVDGGDIAFLTGHSPFVGALDPGVVTVRDEAGADERFAVHGGFVELSNDQLSLLTDVAEPASQIDVERARAAKSRAEDALRTDPADSEAVSALRRAEVRLAVAGVAETAAH